MIHFIKRALADIRSNKFLNLITIITISLSIMMVSVFLLFFENASRVIESWNQGGRAMIYLKEEFNPDMLPQLKTTINSLGDIDEIVYISKTKALDTLKETMSSQTTFLTNLEHNPLPDAIEIKIRSYRNLQGIQSLVQNIKAIDIVDTIEYGQGWLGKFLKIFNLFKITGYTMCGFFFLMALFITANTVRLAFYSRKLEVEIMRLVGATETFIKAPFYIEGIIQGFVGGILGVGTLLITYMMISSGITQSIAAYVYFDIQFLSSKTVMLIIFSSTFLGWVGCYLSLKQIFK